MTAAQLSNGVHVALCLRELRNRLGVTQKALAKDMRTTPQIVSRWERGKEPLNTG
jgi:transcriptional regulator with XRE-family HTH domain